MGELTNGVGENGDSSAEVLLVSLMTGLWSTFSEDRENAHKLILWLDLLKHMVRLIIPDQSLYCLFCRPNYGQSEAQGPLGT